MDRPCEFGSRKSKWPHTDARGESSQKQFVRVSMSYSISACDALELRSDHTSGALDWPVSLWSRGLSGGSKLLGFLSARIDSMVDGAGRDIIDFAHGYRLLAVETRARAPRAISIGIVFPIGVFLQPNAGKSVLFLPLVISGSDI